MRIHHMRTFFLHEMDAETFPNAILGQIKAMAERQLASNGLVPVEALRVLDVELRPSSEVDGAHPVTAYVNASRWLAKCECGGCELVDLAKPMFMCCSCWNAAIGGAWRPVVIPKPATRRAIEGALLARPVAATRNFQPERGEDIFDLRRENRSHELPARANAEEVNVA